MTQETANNEARVIPLVRRRSAGYRKGLLQSARNGGERAGLTPANAEQPMYLPRTCQAGADDCVHPRPGLTILSQRRT